MAQSARALPLHPNQTMPAPQVSIPIAHAVIRSLAVDAAKGNQRTQRLFTQLLTATERDNKRLTSG